jgi:hypothetical protein
MKRYLNLSRRVLYCTPDRNSLHGFSPDRSAGIQENIAQTNALLAPEWGLRISYGDLDRCLALECVAPAVHQH